MSGQGLVWTEKLDVIFLFVFVQHYTNHGANSTRLHLCIVLWDEIKFSELVADAVHKVRLLNSAQAARHISAQQKIKIMTENVFVQKAFTRFHSAASRTLGRFRIMSQTHPPHPHVLFFFSCCILSDLHQGSNTKSGGNEQRQSLGGMANSNVVVISWWGLRFLGTLGRYSVDPAGAGGLQFQPSWPDHDEQRSCWLWPLMQFTLLQNVSDLLILTLWDTVSLTVTVNCGSFVNVRTRGL